MHRDRALAAGNPAAHRWEALRPANRWEDVSDEDLLAMSLHRERGQMVLDDLRALPDTPLVVAEGTTLPAWAAPPERAVWLLGTYRARSRLERILGEQIVAEAREHGLPTLAAADLAEVERRFADALAAGPCAPEEREALLREADEAIREQVRGFHSRPWAPAE